MAYKVECKGLLYPCGFYAAMIRPQLNRAIRTYNRKAYETETHGRVTTITIEDCVSMMR